MRRLDQACVGTVVGLSLIVIAGYWIWGGGPKSGVIEIERAEPLTADFLVDINAADWPELMLLPDVGETLARRIVELREREGRFTEPEDLLRVSGVGPKTLARIRPYLAPLPEIQAAAEQ